VADSVVRVKQVFDMLMIEAGEIIEKKNRAYACTVDPLRNFMLAERAGICKAEVGLLIRVQDKLARLMNYVEQGHECLGEEGYRDSLLDIINYMVLMHALIIYKSNGGD